MLRVQLSLTMMMMRTCLLLWSLTSLTGCTVEPDQARLQKARGLRDKGNLEDSLSAYQSIFNGSAKQAVKILAAKELTTLALQTHDFDLALKGMSAVSELSHDPDERVQSQQQIADTLFYQKHEYKTAIVHYSNLVQRNYNFVRNQLHIVKSYFQLNEFPQSLLEADKLLQAKLDSDTLFDLSLLKANIFFADKKFRNAAKAYYDIIETFPDRAIKSFVHLNLAMSYEEEGVYDKAVETLESLRPHYHTPSFIDAKLKHLGSKMKYVPGAKGFVK